jgi:hypothetical protein
MGPLSGVGIVDARAERRPVRQRTDRWTTRDYAAGVKFHEWESA